MIKIIGDFFFTYKEKAYVCYLKTLQYNWKFLHISIKQLRAHKITLQAESIRYWKDN